MSMGNIAKGRVKVKAQNEIDKIKERIEEHLLVLPGYSRCERCDKVARITRRVKTTELDLKVCTPCAVAAEELGLPVRDIL
jgi:hypothetical protein